MKAFTHFVCKTSVALAALCLVPAVSSGSWSLPCSTWRTTA